MLPGKLRDEGRSPGVERRLRRGRGRSRRQPIGRPKGRVRPQRDATLVAPVASRAREDGAERAPSKVAAPPKVRAKGGRLNTEEQEVTGDIMEAMGTPHIILTAPSSSYRRNRFNSKSGESMTPLVGYVW